MADTTPIKGYRAHRFRDLLALTLGNQPTVYLTEAMASSLGLTIKCFKLDVEKNTFQDSKLRTFTDNDG